MYVGDDASTTAVVGAVQDEGFDQHTDSTPFRTRSVENLFGTPETDTAAPMLDEDIEHKATLVESLDGMEELIDDSINMVRMGLEVTDVSVPFIATVTQRAWGMWIRATPG